MTVATEHTASETQVWRRLAGPLFAERALGQCLELAGWVVLARRLGTHQFGVLSISFLIARYAGLVADWGASVGGPRDVARDDDHLTRCRALVVRRRRVAVLLALAFTLGALAGGRGDMMPMVGVIAMLGLSRDWIAVGLHRGARAALPVVVQGSLVLGVALAFGSPRHPAVAVGCAYAVSACVSILLNPLPARQVGRAAAVVLDPWMLGAVLTNQVLSSADTLMLGLLGSTAATGIYSAVYRLPNGWLAGVSILSGALLPLTTRVHHDPERRRRLERAAYRTSTASALLLLAATPVVYLMVPVVFGDAYRDGRGPVAVLLVATAIATAAAPLHQFYLAAGNDRTYAGAMAMAATTIVIVSAALIPRFSMMGAATATLAAHSVLALVMLRAVRRTRGVPGAPASDLPAEPSRVR